ncbi:CLUMA_CG011537, isoform A [Clunio marinus]|uniref:CLUMA_CG011537, isoform A n=1 Tax=Clunio marinus TaxID=568069 RepID=A0A1J1ID79_9DIPT|nr:CLUMA_CG011537, isoform A [Clunio marinus]
MYTKSSYAFLIGLSIILSCRCLNPEERQMPQPDLSALKDNVGTLPLSDDYLPAVMQALHYYTEMMQYEIVKNPANDQVYKPPTKRPPVTTRRTTYRTTTTPKRTTRRPSTTTTRRTTSTTTTKRQTTRTTQKPFTTKTTTQSTTQNIEFPYSTEINIWHNPPTTTRPHKPGNYAPEKPPYWIYFGIPMKPEQGYHRPGVQRPQEGINTIADPDWKDPVFTQWFFQSKPKDIKAFDENELQYLDHLPKKLLIDIQRESSYLPAILDFDNVNEFRKKYDDSFYARYNKNLPNMQHMRMKMKIQMQQQRAMLTGRKKAPPTRPYVTMLFLYDLLKREAKAKKLHQFGGFSKELLKTLHDTSQKTGDYQMKFLLETFVERKEVTTPDVLSRINFILSDIKDERGETFRTLRLIPPLYYDL